MNYVSSFSIMDVVQKNYPCMLRIWSSYLVHLLGTKSYFIEEDEENIQISSYEVNKICHMCHLRLPTKKSASSKVLGVPDVQAGTKTQ